MSTAVEPTTTAPTPVIEAPLQNQTPAIINVEDSTINTTEATTPIITQASTTKVPATEAPTASKVSPTQRLSSVFAKAKQTVTVAVSDAQKAINERKAHHNTATTTTTGGTSDVPNTTTTTITTNSATMAAEKKEGKPNQTFKDILNRVKGLKPASTHPAVVEQVSVNEQTVAADSGAPVPPPKDNVKTKSSTNTPNPVLEQFKRNMALLSSYLLQKKKDFTEKKSSDEHQQTATPA